VIRAENGEIRQRLDMLRTDRELRNTDKAHRALIAWDWNVRSFTPQNRIMEGFGLDLDVLQRTLATLRGHSSGLKAIGNLLSWAKFEIEETGYISEQIRQQISSVFRLWDNDFALWICHSPRPASGETEARSSGEVEDKQATKARADLVKRIDDQLERLQALEELALKREELVADAEARAFSLPPAEAMDKLLRYETHLDRRLYQAMDQLERLQRQRRGENVPPPLNVNLGRGN
jgi:hypothetical protein